MHISGQADFAQRLLKPDLPCPSGLKTWNGSDPAPRFAVYRNNVVVSLVDALAQTFPVTQALVGEAFFRAPRVFDASRRPSFVAGELLSGSGAPSSGSPELIAASRSSIRFAYCSESSRPMKRRPSFLATASVVPLPPNGSSTTSSSWLDARMIRPSNCSGIWQPCQPDRSLNVPQTRGKYHVSPSAAKPSGRSCGRRIHVSSGRRPVGLARLSP